MKEINLEKESKLNKANEKINGVDGKRAEIESIKIDENLVVHSKINAFKNNTISIDDGINLVSSVQDFLTQAKFKLTDNEIDVDDLFGELFSKENTSFIYNENEIGDNNRSEATILLVINDFSVFTRTENFKIFSKPCTIKNFEWSLLVKISRECKKQHRLGVYLQCNSLDGLNRFSVNVNAQFTLLDSKIQNNNLTKSEILYFDKEKYQGIQSFIEFDDLSDLNNYYNRENDSITHKVAIN